jgi:DNA-binding winged helix-turn-helix (wHTH) protein/tetratricopeptide (TPR) repeat protein
VEAAGAQSPYLARFESFEVNLWSRELCKSGHRIKLPEQSFQVLAMLLERPGEVVSREAIQKKLWPDDTVVEFENSINAAIKKLRGALGDSADQPRYIGTLARRGYRWKVPVEWVEPPPTQQLRGKTDFSCDAVIEPRAGLAFSLAAPAPAAVLSSQREAEAGGAISMKQHLPLMVIATAVVVAAVAIGAYFFSHSAPKLTSNHPIILADVTNITGDPVFDGTLRQGLASQLEQSPYLDLLSEEQVAGTLRLMGQPAGARLTPELARQLCQRAGGVAMLDGSIAQIGNQYSLILNAFNCSNGALLGSVQAVASDKNHVLGALGSIASSIRQRLGESLASIQKFNTPLQEVTTPSLEALHAYTLGWKANLNGDFPAAVGSFGRAISLDPNFAMAYAVLGTVYFNLNEPTLAAENTQRSYKLRERVSEREKFYISSHYEILVTGDLEKAIQVLELWAQTYPRDAVPTMDLPAHYLILGLHERALASARRALELDSESAANYMNIADSYVNLNRCGEAAGVLEQARARRVDSVFIYAVAYELAFHEGKTAEMARDTAWASGKPGIEDLFLNYESDTAAFAGHLTRANVLAARAIALARQAGEKETASTYQANSALREALAGNAAEAQKQASAAWHASNSRHTEAMAALALALSGNLTQAQKLADDLAKRYPQDTIAQFNYLPTIRGAIALGQKSPTKAITELEAASQYELGTPALLIFLNLYPLYVRGEAYLAARRGVAAEAEFQKILDHPGVAFNEVIAPLAHLGVGRARGLSGDQPGARKAYEDFFALWEHADADLPVLRQARAEYAKLK